MSSANRKTIRVVDMIDQFDLRKVISQKTYLEAISEHYKLEHLEGVVFTNKKLTRFRMVVKLFSTVFVCSPWIDEAERHSLYLKISEEISLMAQVDTRVKLTGLQEEKRRRME